MLRRKIIGLGLTPSVNDTAAGPPQSSWPLKSVAKAVLAFKSVSQEAQERRRKSLERSFETLQRLPAIERFRAQIAATREAADSIEVWVQQNSVTLPPARNDMRRASATRQYIQSKRRSIIIGGHIQSGVRTAIVAGLPAASAFPHARGLDHLPELKPPAIQFSEPSDPRHLWRNGSGKIGADSINEQDAVLPMDEKSQRSRNSICNDFTDKSFVETVQTSSTRRASVFQTEAVRRSSVRRTSVLRAEQDAANSQATLKVQMLQERVRDLKSKLQSTMNKGQYDKESELQAQLAGESKLLKQQITALRMQIRGGGSVDGQEITKQRADHQRSNLFDSIRGSMDGGKDSQPRAKIMYSSPTRRCSKVQLHQEHQSSRAAKFRYIPGVGRTFC